MRLSFISVLSFVVATYASTVADVLNDLQIVKGQNTFCLAQVVAFPQTGGTLAGALAIHNCLISNLIPATSTTTTDVTNVAPLPLSVTDATSFSDGVRLVKAGVQGTLALLVQRKPAFAALPVGGYVALIRTDILNLNIAMDALLNAVLAQMPTASLVYDVGKTKSSLDDSFTAAIAAYA